jgi:hypothetical protein
MRQVTMGKWVHAANIPPYYRKEAQPEKAYQTDRDSSGLMRHKINEVEYAKQC